MDGVQCKATHFFGVGAVLAIVGTFLVFGGIFGTFAKPAFQSTFSDHFGCLNLSHIVAIKIDIDSARWFWLALSVTLPEDGEFLLKEHTD